jgi:carbon monoxide dehydrogenase subunit G
VTTRIDAYIQNTPEAVVGYIADVRNRSLFLGSLKSVSDIKGDPSSAGTTWKWKWVAVGMEFEGIGRCLQYEPGRLYSFRTEGGIESKWTYKAEPQTGGTKLSVELEYQVPGNVLQRLRSKSILENLAKGELERAIQNLKVILDK